MTLPATVAVRSGIFGLLARWGAELRSNRRAMAGLLIVLVIIAGDGFLLLREATAEKRAEYAREQAQLQRVAAIAREHDWPQRAAASAALRGQLEGRLWSAESDGVARADLQDWLTGIAHDIGLAMFDVRIELAAPKSLAPDMRQITATITTQPDETALIALLERIERAPHLAVVDRLSIRPAPSPYLEMTLTAYARIGPRAASASGPRPLTPDRGQPQ